MIMVTGATGLVGGNLLWHLLQYNERVAAIKRNTSKLDALRTIFSFYTNNPDAYLSRIDWKNADVLNENSLLEAFANSTVVYHCAAVVSLGNGNDALVDDTNVIGTRNVVNVALKVGVEKLCFVSSIAACGKSMNKSIIDENTNWVHSSLRSAYSLSKYNSEQEVWKAIGKGLNAVIINPGVILGVSGTNTGSSQLFSQVQKGLMFYTNGGSGYVDVQDVARAMIQLTKSDITGERFILVAENCSNKDLLCWMADGFHKKRPFIPLGKKILGAIGFVSEIVGFIFRIPTLIDRSTARTATNREYYSSEKIRRSIDFQFTSIQKCTYEVCQFLMK